MPERSRARGRRWFATAACSLAVLATGTELGARWLGPRLPEPLVWHSEETQVKVEQMDQLAAGGGVDVVFLGTSMVNSEFRPADLEARGVTGYNAALSSSIPALTLVWAEEVVLPRLHPSVVVIGVSSVDVHSGSPGRTTFYDAFARSAGGKAVLGTEGLLDRASRQLRNHLAVWRHRVALRDPELVVDGLLGRDPEVEALAASIQPDGHMDIWRGLRFGQRSGGPNLRGFAVSTADLETLAAVAGAARRAGATPVFVELPVTDVQRRRHPHPDDYARFEAALQRMAAAEDVALIDLDGLRDTRYFADVIHMNEVGAVEATRSIIAELDRLGLLERRP